MRDQHLEIQIGMYVADLLADNHAVDDLLRRDAVTQTHARRQYLGVRTAVDDTAFGVHGLDGRNKLTLIAQFKVRIVLDNQDVILLCHREQLLAALERHGAAGRVLESRDDIDELDVRRGLKQFLELVHAHALVVHRDAHQLGIHAAESVERADEGRVLADDDIARIEHNLREQADRLLSAGGDEDIIVVRTDVVLLLHALCSQLAQLRIALGRAILQRNVRLVEEDLRADLRHFLIRKRYRIRRTGGKGNHRRVNQYLEDLTDCGRLHRRNMVCDFIFHFSLSCQNKLWDGVSVPIPIPIKFYHSCPRFATAHPHRKMVFCGAFCVFLMFS